jgi:hypothetical protein
MRLHTMMFCVTSVADPQICSNPHIVPFRVIACAMRMQVSQQQWARALEEPGTISFRHLVRAIQLAEAFFTTCSSLPSSGATPIEFTLQTEGSKQPADGVISLCLVIVGQQWRYTSASAKLVASLYQSVPEVTSAAAQYAEQDENPLFTGDQLNTAFVYQAIKPSGKEPEYKGKIPGMRTELRRFQVCQLAIAVH